MNIPNGYQFYQAYQRPSKRAKRDKNSVVLELPPEFLPEQRDPEPEYQIMVPLQSPFSGPYLPPMLSNQPFLKEPYHLPMVQNQHPFVGPQRPQTIENRPSFVGPQQPQTIENRSPFAGPQQPEIIQDQPPEATQNQDCSPNSLQPFPQSQNSQSDQHTTEANSLVLIENSGDVSPAELQEFHTQNCLSNTVRQMISTASEQSRTTLPKALYRSAFHVIKLCLSHIYHELHSEHKEVGNAIFLIYFIPKSNFFFLFSFS